LFIGLKQSRTKDYLSELVENGKIVPMSLTGIGLTHWKIKSRKPLTIKINYGIKLTG